MEEDDCVSALLRSSLQTDAFICHQGAASELIGGAAVSRTCKQTFTAADELLKLAPTVGVVYRASLSLFTVDSDGLFRAGG